MRLPKHATVVSYLALFTVLGGTAYAATGGNLILGHANKAGQPTSLKNTGSGPALKLTTNNNSTPPFAVSNGTKIAKLNADKVDGLNASAFQLRSHRIYAKVISGTGNHVAGKAGPWKYTINCAPGGPSLLTLSGPGTIDSTTTVASGSNAGTTFVGGTVTADGFLSSVGDGAQMTYTAFLKSGSTIMKVQWQMTASFGGVFENCDVIGDFTPVPSG